MFPRRWRQNLHLGVLSETIGSQFRKWRRAAHADLLERPTNLGRRVPDHAGHYELLAPPHGSVAKINALFQADLSSRCPKAPASTVGKF